MFKRFFILIFMFFAVVQAAQAANLWLSTHGLLDSNTAKMLGAGEGAVVSVPVSEDSTWTLGAAQAGNFVFKIRSIVATSTSCSMLTTAPTVQGQISLDDLGANTPLVSTISASTTTGLVGNINLNLGGLNAAMAAMGITPTSGGCVVLTDSVMVNRNSSEVSDYRYTRATPISCTPTVVAGQITACPLFTLGTTAGISVAPEARAAVLNSNSEPVGAVTLSDGEANNLTFTNIGTHKLGGGTAGTVTAFSGVSTNVFFNETDSLVNNCLDFNNMYNGFTWNDSGATAAENQCLLQSLQAFPASTSHYAGIGELFLSGYDPEDPISENNSKLTLHIQRLGNAECWGDNTSGQVGNNTLGGDVTVTDAVRGTGGTGAFNIKQISAGYHFTCGLTSGGVPYCWGKNTKGQLGDGLTATLTHPTAANPVTLPSGITATQVAAGYDHACDLLSNGKVQCWGNNDSGQLGSNSGDANSTTPEYVKIRTGAASYTDLSNVTQISSGYKYSCAIIKNGQGVVCWGNNDRGQLGNASTTNFAYAVPTAIYDLSGTGGMDTFQDNTLFTGIYTGYKHTCMLGSNGVVYCWGDNSACQITASCTANGGAIDNYTSPVRADLPAGAIYKVALGYHNTCYLIGDSNLAVAPPAASGSVYCLGANADGQLGDGSTTSIYGSPVKTVLPESNTYSADLSCSTAVNPTTHVVEGSHCCTVLVQPGADAATETRCWGSNGSQKLGVISSDVVVTTPSEVLSARTPIETANGILMTITSGGDNTCAISYAAASLKSHNKKKRAHE